MEVTSHDRKEKILLIDDDKDFLIATKLILEKGGYEVFLAEDGKTGVEMWKSVAPDLAIIDMMMETWGEGFSVLDQDPCHGYRQRYPAVHAERRRSSGALQFL